MECACLHIEDKPRRRNKVKLLQPSIHYHHTLIEVIKSLKSSPLRQTCKKILTKHCIKLVEHILSFPDAVPRSPRVQYQKHTCLLKLHSANFLFMHDAPLNFSCRGISRMLSGFDIWTVCLPSRLILL